MDTMQQIVMQEMNEQRYNRKLIDGQIEAAILHDESMLEKIEQGVALLREWQSGTYYASKMKRLEQLGNLDLQALVLQLFVGVAYYQKPELFTSVTAQMASRLKFDDKAEAITTVAEIMAVLCQTDAFDIDKASRSASLMAVSRIPLSDSLIGFINESQYLPPMVCLPLELENNYSSGYLSHNDSLILGKGNHHDGDICLDVLNVMNKVALKLDTAFLSRFEEEPTFAMDTPDKCSQWAVFKAQSYKFYSLMVQQGNRFHLTHKVDKRGRIYSCGYHITTQGTAQKKAMLEFAKEELVTGVM